MPTHAFTRRRLALGSAALVATAVVRPTGIAYALGRTSGITTKDRKMDHFAMMVAWLERRIEELGVPGAAIGVVHGDQRASIGIGIADSESGLAFTPRTPFGIASLSKIFTATSLAVLAQQGQVGYGDSVLSHVPDFRLGDPVASGSLTVGYVLSHAGGWADTLEPVEGEDSLDWYAAQMGSLPQISPVGARLSYSNSGFMLAGAITEHVAGQAFEETVSDLVLQPLGMGDSGFSNAMESSSRVVGHQPGDGKQVRIPQGVIPRVINPAGGIVSTVDDMLHFIAAHADIEAGTIAPSALAGMREPRNSGGSLGPIVVDAIGAGWMLLDIGGEQVLMSQGGDSGLISAMVAVPSRQFGMVVFANSDSAMMLVNDAVLHGMKEFLGISRSDPDMYAMSDAELSNAEGQFGLPEWLTFSVSQEDMSLVMMASAGGQEIPEMSGRLTMVSPNSGFMPYLGGRLWIDLVPDESGTIEWLRFAGRLLPRLA